LIENVKIDNNIALTRCGEYSGAMTLSSACYRRGRIFISYDRQIVPDRLRIKRGLEKSR